MKTLNAYHREWASRIMPKDAPQAQKQEMERAFYAGAAVCWRMMLTDISDLPDDKAEQAMTDLTNEITDYFKLLATIPGPHGTSKQ